MSFPTLISTLIVFSYSTVFREVIANQELLAVNCSSNPFNRVNHNTLIDSIKDLANEVASSDLNIHKLQISSFEGGVKYYGTKVINITKNSANNVTTVYEMVRCTSNLSVQDCSSCLMAMINKLSKGCNGRLGGRVVNSNCFIRYEISPFYNISAMESAVLPLFTTLPIASKNTIRNRLGKISLNTIIAITVPTSILLGLATFGIGLCVWKAKQKNYSRFPTSDDDHFDTVESLRYSLDTLKAATQDFSDDNKIGQGGFGCVYKGILESGYQIAVKKLFRSSSHVDEEFKNEVKVLAKLQHRNLVKLVGFCLAEDERLLVFEYVPNPSLDKVLFDPGERFRLDWLTRFKIIVGIARALLYLHEESRFKIVHRDLKPGNILLDNQMMPKIADFGMARFYGIKKQYVEASNARGICLGCNGKQEPPSH